MQLIKMSCDACDREFEREDKRCLAIARHCCSLRCGKQFRTTNKQKFFCERCKKDFERWPSQAQNERLFCSRDCVNADKRERPELWPDNSAARNTSEACAKATVTRQRKQESGELQHPWLGRKHREETIEQIKATKAENPPIGKKNGMFGKRHSEESRDAMSETRTRKMVEGAYKEYGKNNHLRGDYTSEKVGKTFRYRSSWEFACMCYLDMNEGVATWDYECLRIPYLLRDHKRWYIPDFLVTFSDNRKEMWELKPAKFCDNEKTLLKSQAAQQYCNENSISAYHILTKQCLINRGIL